jgi:hypothetical protein
MPELTITSPYVDSNTCTMGNPVKAARVDLSPMPESTSSRSQGLRIWPPKRFITGLKSTLHEALFPVHNVYSAAQGHVVDRHRFDNDPDPDFQVGADPDPETMPIHMRILPFTHVGK